MKMIAWLLLASTAVGIGGIVMWDASLESEASVWLEPERSGVRAHDNGYLALMGLFAAEDDDPQAVGRARVRDYERSGTHGAEQSPVEFGDYPESRRLDTGDELEALCKVELRACLSEYASSSVAIRSASEKHALLLRRYTDLYRFGLFVSTATPGVEEPQIPFPLLYDLNRLLHASIAVQFLADQVGPAMERLNADIQFQRRLLEESDSLALKQSAASMLGRDLHLYAQLLDAVEGVDVPASFLTINLDDLSAEERSLAAALRREFQSVALSFLGAEMIDSVSSDLQMPRWLVRAVYKPNATVNSVYEHFSNLASEQALEAAAFVRRRESQVPKRSIWDRVHNPVGSILAEVASPELDRSVLNLHEVTGLLRLVKLKQMIRVGHLAANRVSEFLAEHTRTLGSPYADGPMRWDPERQVIYFNGSGHSYIYRELPVPFI